MSAQEWSGAKAGAPTLLVIRLLEPAGVKKPLWENLVPSIDNQRLSTNDDVDQNELLKLLLPKVANLGPRDSLNPLEVGGPVDQAVQIQIRWNRIELGLRMKRGRHLIGFPVRASYV